MKKLLALLLLSPLLVSSDGKTDYDSSELYSFLDEAKLKVGKVLYCAQDIDHYYVYKLDFISEHIISANTHDRAMLIQPIIEIKTTKNTIMFKAEPHLGWDVNSSLDDISTWRRWYIDKINKTASYRFYNEDKFLTPIKLECFDFAPQSVKK